jgi:hypothetical protein
MGCLPCGNESGSETEEVIDNPRIDPQGTNATVRPSRAAIPDNPTVQADNRGDTTIDVHRQPEPDNAAGTSNHPGFSTTRNPLGGVQVHGDVERITYKNGSLRITDDHGQVRTLRGGGGPAQTGGDRRDRHRPGAALSSLESSSTGPATSIGSGQNEKPKGGDGESDGWSNVDTLVDRGGTQVSMESGIGGSFRSSGWSSSPTRGPPSSSAVPTTAASDGTNIVNRLSGTHIQINGNVSNLYGSTGGLEIRGQVHNIHRRNPTRR